MASRATIGEDGYSVESGNLQGGNTYRTDELPDALMTFRTHPIWPAPTSFRLTLQTSVTNRNVLQLHGASDISHDRPWSSPWTTQPLYGRPRCGPRTWADPRPGTIERSQAASQKQHPAAQPSEHCP